MFVGSAWERKLLCKCMVVLLEQHQAAMDANGRGRGGQGASTEESAECLVTEGCPRSVDLSALTHPYLGSGTWRCLPETR